MAADPERLTEPAGEEAVRRCPACGGPMFGWVVARAADPGVAGTWVIDTCADCGHGLLRDPPEKPELYETGAYGPVRHRGARLLSPVLRGFDRSRLRLVREGAAPPARVLEVGAGRGRFLAALSSAGYEADGIELAPRRAQEARERGLEVQPASLERAVVEPASRDAVVLWHVLEHLPDPDAGLATIRDWVRPGGVVVIGLPNRASWQCGLGREHWFHLDVPRHVSHFTPSSLELMLRRHGLEVERTRHVLAEHNPFGMWQTILNAVTFHDGVAYGLINRSLTARTADSRWKLGVDVAVTAAAAIPAAVVAVPLEALAGALGRGGTIGVLARAR